MEEVPYEPEKGMANGLLLGAASWLVIGMVALGCCLGGCGSATYRSDTAMGRVEERHTVVAGVYSETSVDVSDVTTRTQRVCRTDGTCEDVEVVVDLYERCLERRTSIDRSIWIDDESSCAARSTTGAPYQPVGFGAGFGFGGYGASSTRVFR